MAENIRRQPSGTYLVQVRVGDRRPSATFDTLREATAWRDRQRVLAKAEKRGQLGNVHTLRQAIERYRDEVAPSHKGARWEHVRCDALLKRKDLPLTLPLARVNSEHLEAWRDARLREVKSSSALRDLNLIGSIFGAAVATWKWIDTSPVPSVAKPKESPPRDVTLSRAEIKAMLRALGHRRRRPRSLKEIVALVMLITLRTGMRSSEITGLTWNRYKGSFVTLLETKNGHSRDVPVPKKARVYFTMLQGLDDELVCPVSSQSRDALWRKARSAAGLSGFTFHDLRHTAATWVGRSVGQPGRLSFPQFCKAFGWRDPKMALRYVNPTAAELAELM